MRTYSKNKSIEYNDNRISKYVAQYGKCYVTGEEIGIERVHCHHIVPIKQGGDDKYNNSNCRLVYTQTDSHDES